ncbi:MAG TPA: helix-turn-helix transcriptional regulator, partial [Ktedonobacteraceae bacterium]|nr:helix-turn-helix transcriptional regulator [Ktedonobacteraceae bacterium]
MSRQEQTSVGQRLRRERERLNWSQERLAEAIQTTAGSINRWENDKTLPQPHYREQ